MLRYDWVGLGPNMISKVTFSPQEKRDFEPIIFLSLSSHIFLICYYSTLEEGVTININIFESSILKDTF